MASKYGNFKDYYKFNKVEERMKPVFDAKVMTKFVRDIRAQNPPVVVILDVGCNCGDLTLSFYDLLLAQLSSSSSSSLSSDSDSSSNSSSSSLPEEGEGKGKEEVGGKRKLERDDDPLPQKIRRCEEGEQRQKVLGDSTSSPQVAILGIDIDPELIERANKTIENRNITYLSGDLMEKEKTDQVRGFLSKCGAKSFDLVMCFSVTMWIHLNRGDKGLAEFLGLCCSLSRNVLVEPQPWKCYKSAKKRSKRGKEGEPQIDYNTLSNLKYRENVESFICDQLKSENFALVEMIGTTKWTRNLTWWERKGRN